MVSKIKNFALGTSLFIAVIVIWKALCVFGVISPWILSGPEDTIKEFVTLIIDGTLPKMLAISCLNIFPAFFVAVAISLVLGIPIGMNKTVSRIFSPFLSSIYLIPSLAWLPLIVLFLGFDRSAIWVVIFISSFVRMIYSVIGGVRNVNVNWLLVAQNIELKKIDIIMKVVLPGALPQIMSGIRVGFGSAWRSLIGAEMLVITAGGLGKYIWMSQWTFKFEQVFSGIITIALVGIAIEVLLFKKIEEATLFKWGMIQ